MINNKSITGAAIFTAAAAGSAAASPKGRSIVNKLVHRKNDDSTQDNMLASWLKDAHAMEDAQIKMLKGLIKDFKDDKVIKDKLNQHLKQTERQKKDVERCLTMIDEKPAKSKDLMGKIVGIGGGIDTKLFKDKKVKDFLMLHSGEHFEYASYLALASAAEAAKKKNIAATANRIAKEEKEMAAWAEKTLPAVVKQYI